MTGKISKQIWEMRTESLSVQVVANTLEEALICWDNFTSDSGRPDNIWCKGSSVHVLPEGEVFK